MENLEKIKKKFFWKNKKVLITGHTGFKGSWLSIWLNMLGAKISGISLPPATNPNLFQETNLNQICNSHICDIRKFKILKKKINKIKPQVIFHLAAQPLVRESYKKSLETISTNVMGTANILETAKNTKSVKVIIIVTTDKVYQNIELRKKFKETDTLGGHDTYSASKAACEIIVDAYKKSFFNSGNRKIAISTARAGNVIGGGDWSKDRLIPDIIKNYLKNSKLLLRNPSAVRPWQHVLDSLKGYITLAERSWKDCNLAGCYNFGPKDKQVASVEKVCDLINLVFKKKFIIAKGSKKFHESNYLSLDIKKAKKNLNFESKWSFKKSINRTINWYLLHNSNPKLAKLLCEKDIKFYEKNL